MTPEEVQEARDQKKKLADLETRVGNLEKSAGVEAKEVKLIPDNWEELSPEAWAALPAEVRADLTREQYLSLAKDQRETISLDEWSKLTLIERADRFATDDISTVGEGDEKKVVKAGKTPEEKAAIKAEVDKVGTFTIEELKDYAAAYDIEIPVDGLKADILAAVVKGIKKKGVPATV